MRPEKAEVRSGEILSNDGPIRFADLKDGEVYNAAMQPSYSGIAMAVKAPVGVVPCNSDNVPVTEHECFMPTLLPGNVLDFGQIIAGSEALGEALLKALQVHTNFRVRPVVCQGKLMASIEDVKKPPLYREDGRKRRLGTDETEGLLIYVTYLEKVITLHVFHGLSDFRGICAFLRFSAVFS